MVKGGGVVGAVLGAGGATAYYNGLDFSGAMRHMLTPGWGASGSPNWPVASSSSREVEELTRLVDQLAKDMRRQQAGITILTSQKGGGGVILYGSAAAAATLLYFRLVHGWKLTDMLYVTRAGLSKSISQVTAGMDGLTQRLMSVKQFLQEQDDAMRAQAEMQSQLGDVGTEVDRARSDVAEVHVAVKDLEVNMESMAQRQDYANDGIYVLCRVVSDMMKGGSQKLGSVLELEKYLKRPPNLPGRISRPGLETLLAASEAPSSGGGRLQTRLMGGPDRLNSPLQSPMHSALSSTSFNPSGMHPVWNAPSRAPTI